LSLKIQTKKVDQIPKKGRDLLAVPPSLQLKIATSFW